MQDRNEILTLLRRFRESGIERQIDYNKFYLYSIITHSTAIEGSTVTEIENQLLFDEGIAPADKSVIEQMMNLDLKAAYEQSALLAHEGKTTKTYSANLCSTNYTIISLFRLPNTIIVCKRKSL